MLKKRIIAIILLLTIVVGGLQKTIIASPPSYHNFEGVRWIDGYKVKIVNYNTYKLSWHKVYGAKKYVVKVGTKGKTTKYTAKKNFVKIKKLKKNRKYEIYICALNKKKKKIASTKQKLHTYLTKPVFSNSKFDKTIEIEWRVDFANVKVQLYRSDTINGQYTEVGQPTKCELSHDFFYDGYCSRTIDGSAVINNTYYYKARIVKVIKHKKKYGKFSKPVMSEAINSKAQIEFNKIYQNGDEILISIKSLKGNRNLIFSQLDSENIVKYSNSVDGDYNKLEDSVVLKQDNTIYFKITLKDKRDNRDIIKGSYKLFRESSYKIYHGIYVSFKEDQIKVGEYCSYINY